MAHGEMSERFKELVLKTSDRATDRGFESHSLPQMGVLIFYESGIRKGDTSQQTGVIKCPVDT